MSAWLWFNSLRCVVFKFALRRHRNVLVKCVWYLVSASWGDKYIKYQWMNTSKQIITNIKCSIFSLFLSTQSTRLKTIIYLLYSFTSILVNIERYVNFHLPFVYYCKIQHLTSAIKKNRNITYRSLASILASKKMYYRQSILNSRKLLCGSSY